jgi:hypothetical protein
MCRQADGTVTRKNREASALRKDVISRNDPRRGIHQGSNHEARRVLTFPNSGESRTKASSRSTPHVSRSQKTEDTIPLDRGPTSGTASNGGHSRGIDTVYHAGTTERAEVKNPADELPWIGDPFIRAGTLIPTTRETTRELRAT